MSWECLDSDLVALTTDGQVLIALTWSVMVTGYEMETLPSVTRPVSLQNFLILSLRLSFVLLLFLFRCTHRFFPFLIPTLYLSAKNSEKFCQNGLVMLECSFWLFVKSSYDEALGLRVRWLGDEWACERRHFLMTYFQTLGSKATVCTILLRWRI